MGKPVKSQMRVLVQRTKFQLPTGRSICLPPRHRGSSNEVECDPSNNSGLGDGREHPRQTSRFIRTRQCRNRLHRGQFPRGALASHAPCIRPRSGLPRVGKWLREHRLKAASSMAGPNRP